MYSGKLAIIVHQKSSVYVLCIMMFVVSVREVRGQTSISGIGNQIACISASLFSSHDHIPLLFLHARGIYIYYRPFILIKIILYTYNIIYIILYI